MEPTAAEPAKPEISADELMIILGAKEAELYAARRDAGRARASHARAMQAAEAEVLRLREEIECLKGQNAKLVADSKVLYSSLPTPASEDFVPSENFPRPAG